MLEELSEQPGVISQVRRNNTNAPLTWDPMQTVQSTLQQRCLRGPPIENYLSIHETEAEEQLRHA